MRALWFSFVLAVSSLLGLRAEIIISHSGQFYVHGRKSIPLDVVPPGSTWVQPDFLAVTAERVKHALAGEVPALGGRGKAIHLNIIEDAPRGMPIGIVTTKFDDGWAYQVAVPLVVDEARLVKALAQVIMVEYANRTPGNAAEIPNWLVEGLAQQLFFSVGPKLVVDQISTGWQGEIRDFQRRTREVMRTNATPTFKELTMSSPPAEKTSGELLFQSSAHLLVRSLLNSPGGRQRMAAFLQKLPQTWNWQTAFREAYGFSTMLDVEKWWALVTLEFTTRDGRQAWSMETSLRKVDDLLNTTLQMRGATNALPEMRVVDLKALLREDNWSLQREALLEKLLQLNFTTPHLAPAVAGLAVGYRDAIDSYVKRRDRIGVEGGLRMTPEARVQGLVSDFARRVDDLDSKRRALALTSLTSK